MSMSPPPPEGAYGYEPPESLWQLVESFVPPHEHHEVKVILGESLVDTSIELHEEIRTLLEIWRDYREDADEVQPSPLPEPPAARERLCQEIRFFVESLQEKAKENGRDVDEVMSKHSATVLHYALDDLNRCYSRSSGVPTARSSRDGRETPMRRGTPNSDGMSLTSSLSEEVESMNDKLNVLKLDEVVQHLRETLESEVDQLKHHIVFLQECLEEEADVRSQVSMEREPTLTELKEERSKLEKHLLSREDSLPEALRDSPKRSPPRVLSSGSASTKLRLNQQQTSSPAKLQPIKASHQINTQLDSNHAKPHPPSGPKTDFSLRNLPGTSHVTIRTSCDALPASAKVVKVATITASEHSPSPPSSAKPGSRPSSASRFRRMVLECRDSS